MRKLLQTLSNFARDERGVTSIEFVIVFPVFFGFFLMTYEGGMIAAKHVMLERGVDIAVRDVRIGVMPNPTREQLRVRICDVAMIIPDCINQLDLEMVRDDPTAWTGLPANVECINRGEINPEELPIDATANNQLMLLRVCARIDALLPTTGLGKVIVRENAGSAADGSLALVSTAAFVVEPFRATN